MSELNQKNKDELKYYHLVSGRFIIGNNGTSEFTTSFESNQEFFSKEWLDNMVIKGFLDVNPEVTDNIGEVTILFYKQMTKTQYIIFNSKKVKQNAPDQNNEEPAF